MDPLTLANMNQEYKLYNTQKFPEGRKIFSIVIFGSSFSKAGIHGPINYRRLSV